MGQAASSREGSKSSKSLNGDYYRKPGHHCYYRTCTIILGVVSLGLLITVAVQAVFLKRTSLDVRSFFATCSPDAPFPPSSEPLFASFPDSHAVPYCQERWVGYGGKCYYFSTEEKSWDASQRFCSSFNASLAGIDTQQEKDFVMRYAGLVEHWIGLRRESGQPWKWVNGTQLKQQLFEVRAEGDCAYVSDIFVSSSRCYSVRNWICSKPDAYTKAKEDAMEEDLSWQNERLMSKMDNRR